MKLTDICVNLSNSQFNSDRDQVLARAAAADVSRLLLVGTDIESSLFCADWARQREGLFATAGIHPHDADSAPDDWLTQVRDLAEQVNVVAIGETGLDFNRNYSSRDGQISCFADQTALAEEMNMPLFVHDRESDGLVLDMLKGTRVNVVIHCFTGNASELASYIEAGFYIGITGWICDIRRGQALRDMIGNIPLDRLLLETDAPFLRPHNTPDEWFDRNGLDRRMKKRSEPALLPYVLEIIAANRSEPLSEIASATQINATRLFNLPE